MRVDEKPVTQRAIGAHAAGDDQRAQLRRDQCRCRLAGQYVDHGALEFAGDVCLAGDGQ